jgi:VanZ family protein
MSDKTGHFLAYGGLGMLVLRAVAGARWGGVNANTSFAAWGITAAYGVSDEFHQRFVVGRTAAVDDCGLPTPPVPRWRLLWS